MTPLDAARAYRDAAAEALAGAGVTPVETDLGRKRRINPTSCNVDLSCLKGFCPSFVTLPGAPSAPDADVSWQGRETGLAADLPMPTLPVLMLDESAANDAISWHRSVWCLLDQAKETFKLEPSR